MTNLQILFAILAFVVLTFGTFIWFVATWDAEKEPSLSFFWRQIPLPEASDFSRKIETPFNERAIA